MTNKQRIEKKLSGTGLTLGGYNAKMELLNASNLKKVADNMLHDTTDVDVSINRKPFVVEISHVDNEVDFNVISKAEYVSRYGSERYNN